MSAEGCRTALQAAPIDKRADQLDAAFPNCACEPWSLTEGGGQGIVSQELIGRVLTSPDAYDEAESTILTGKLTQLYAMGLSVIRQGATDTEITTTVEELLNGASEPRRLIGAVIMTVATLRSYANDDDKVRWFGVYATDDRGKTHHGDIFGTRVNKKQQSRRRHRLASDMVRLIVRATDAAELLSKLRDAGF